MKAVARLFPFRIEKRKDIGVWMDLLSIIVAILAALGIAAGIIALSGADTRTVLFAMAKGSLGSKSAIIDTLLKATPIILTGQATVVAFRARVWNIGQEGQLYAGAMGATAIILTFPQFQPPAFLYIPLLLLASMITGAIWGGIAGFLKARYNVSEIIVTVMLNYVIIYICTFLLNGIWQAPGSYYYNTIKFPAQTFLPQLFGTRLHLGFIIALLASAAVYFLLWKMKLGYEIRALGENPTAAKYKGINTYRIIILVMLISGALAGLAGGIEVTGIHHQLIYGFSTGFGFTGILIALLGRLHPLGVVIASIFFGALQNGSSALQIYSDVPRQLVTFMMGLVIIMLLFTQALFTYRVRRVEDVG